MSLLTTGIGYPIPESVVPVSVPGVDYTGVTDSTAAILAAQNNALNEGVNPALIFLSGLVRINTTSLMAVIQPGVSILGAAMGTVNDLDVLYPGQPGGSNYFVSGTTFLDYGTTAGSAGMEVRDPNFPGPNAFARQSASTLSTGGVLSNFSICLASGAVNRIGLRLASMLNTYVENVRVMHYTDGAIPWNPTYTYFIGQSVTFCGNQFTSATNNNIANLPPVTATSNANWTYTSAAIQWSTVNASIGVWSASHGSNFLEKTVTKNLVIEDCTRGLVLDSTNAGGQSLEYNDYGVVFKQGDGQSGIEVVSSGNQTAGNGLNANRCRINAFGNFYQGPLNNPTPAPMMAFGNDGSFSTGNGWSLDWGCETNGTGTIYVWPGSGQTATFTVGQVITFQNAGTNYQCIALTAMSGPTNPSPPTTPNTTNANWVNGGIQASHTQGLVGANYTGTVDNGKMSFAGGQAAVITSGGSLTLNIIVEGGVSTLTNSGWVSNLATVPLATPLWLINGGLSGAAFEGNANSGTYAVPSTNTYFANRIIVYKTSISQVLFNSSQAGIIGTGTGGAVLIIFPAGAGSAFLYSSTTGVDTALTAAPGTQPINLTAPITGLTPGQAIYVGIWVNTGYCQTTYPIIRGINGASLGSVNIGTTILGAFTGTQPATRPTLVGSAVGTFVVI